MVGTPPQMGPQRCVVGLQFPPQQTVLDVQLYPSGLQATAQQVLPHIDSPAGQPASPPLSGAASSPPSGPA